MTAPRLDWYRVKAYAAMALFLASFWAAVLWAVL